MEMAGENAELWDSKGQEGAREGGGPQPGTYIVQTREDIALEAKIQHHHGYQIYAYSFAVS